MEGSGSGSYDVVWPAATTWEGSDRRAIRLPGGPSVTSGTRIQSGGGLLEAVDRGSLSIAPDVTCLGTTTVTAAVIADPASVSVPTG